jgi:hypothetical protein
VGGIFKGRKVAALTPYSLSTIGDPDPATKHRLYLRALYSRRFSDALRVASEKNPKLAFAARLDPERLEEEQAARIRNLAFILKQSCPVLVAEFSETRQHDWIELVDRFVQSDEMWSGIGRTLAESFCLFVVNDETVDSERASRARLAGVISGLSYSNESPWSNHEVTVGPDGVVERFQTAFAPLPRWRDREMAGRPLAIAVRKTSEGKFRFICKQVA